MNQTQKLIEVQDLKKIDFQNTKLNNLFTLIIKLQEFKDNLETDDISPQEKISTLSRINTLNGLIYGKNSIEVFHSESQLGFLYNKYLQYKQAIKHLKIEHNLESNFDQVSEAESIRIAIETSLAYLSLSKHNITQAEEVIHQYLNTQISDLYLRYKMDIVKSKIYLFLKEYSKSLSSLKKAFLSIQEHYSNNDSQEEADIYIEMSNIMQNGRMAVLRGSPLILFIKARGIVMYALFLLFILDA